MRLLLNAFRTSSSRVGRSAFCVVEQLAEARVGGVVLVAAHPLSQPCKQVFWNGCALDSEASEYGFDGRFRLSDTKFDKDSVQFGVRQMSSQAPDDVPCEVVDLLAVHQFIVLAGWRRRSASSSSVVAS